MLINGVPTSHWLYPEEKADVVSGLVECGLIKWDNERKLPLKMGGFTDVYVNLRDARNNPAKAIPFLAGLFAIPLRRLGIARFVEVPDSVSCFAGLLGVETGLPYLTIREQSKEGRVADARVIGQSRKGEQTAIIDDIITDGASKIVPHQQCVLLGLSNLALVVLVDRQQGWQENLAKAGIVLPVWAGMTLHDVRRYLIERGFMERCKPELENANPIIVALDGKSWNEILPLADQLRTTGCILKVNDLLFGEGIDHLVPDLSVYGRVMADIKGHDIPQTVENTCRRLRKHRPWAVTVHASGGPNMVAAAVRGLRDSFDSSSETLVLAVTVLTSLDSKACEDVYVRRPLEQVLALTKMAVEAGADGVVCSPEETKVLRPIYPRLVLVNPGIRSAGVEANDQARIATPAAAKDNGANYLVMGRQILGAADPVAEVKRVLLEELHISI